MLKLSFKTEIIISFFTERGNEGILDIKNFNMSEIEPNVETSYSPCHTLQIVIQTQKCERMTD